MVKCVVYVYARDWHGARKQTYFRRIDVATQTNACLRVSVNIPNENTNIKSIRKRKMNTVFAVCPVYAKSRIDDADSYYVYGYIVYRAFVRTHFNFTKMFATIQYVFEQPQLICSHQSLCWYVFLLLFSSFSAEKRLRNRLEAGRERERASE